MYGVTNMFYKRPGMSAVFNYFSRTSLKTCLSFPTVTKNLNVISNLFFTQKYQEDMASSNKDGSQLEGVLTLLRHTSKLIQLFEDKLPISSTLDRRLKELDNFHHFMIQWREESSQNNSNFVSAKLWFDLQCMCLGFRSMVTTKLTQFPSSVIKPALINQDCVENHFCQVRSCNGQNNHPTYLKQQSTQNSIRFGQTTISRKSNAGNPSTSSFSSCSLPSNV